MLTSLLGLAIGYLTVCVLTEAPKGYKGGEPEIRVFQFLFCFQDLTIWFQHLLGMTKYNHSKFLCLETELVLVVQGPEQNALETCLCSFF